jgi:hypothetical protein
MLLTNSTEEDRAAVARALAERIAQALLEGPVLILASGKVAGIIAHLIMGRLADMGVDTTRVLRAATTYPWREYEQADGTFNFGRAGFNVMTQFETFVVRNLAWLLAAMTGALPTMCGTAVGLGTGWAR